MSENLRSYSRALFGFDAAVARTDSGAWWNQSPCVAWTAMDVVAHTIAMNNMIVGFTRGIGASEPKQERLADPATAWQQSLDCLMEALDTNGALRVVAKTPWGEMAVDKFLGFAWVDPVVHTWDLAKATGQTPVLDEALVTRAIRQLERAGDSIRGDGLFGPPVELGPNASSIATLIAMTGRDPNAD